MLKSYVKEKIMQVMKKNEEELVSAEFRACLLVSPSGYISGNVRCYAHLALASLFGTISDPQSMAVSFRIGCIQEGPHCSALLAFSQHKAQG